MKYHTDQEKFKPDREVMMRLLSPYKLDHVDFGSCTLKGKPAVPIKKAIVHFHGGGFVCMDSASHQCYTR